VSRPPRTWARVPTQNFLAAAGQWNSTTAGGTLKARNAPTQIYSRSGGSFTPAFTITQNTVVLSNGIVNAGAAAYVSITIRGGPRAGQNGFVPATDLAEQNDGPATIDLPTPTVETLSSAQTLNDGVPGPWWRCAAAARSMPGSNGASRRHGPGQDRAGDRTLARSGPARARAGRRAESMGFNSVNELARFAAPDSVHGGRRPRGVRGRAGE
jgi:hypothetical protein